MYVCLCRGVSERKVRAAVVRGARTIDDIGDRCGAGTRCGGCWPLLQDMLDEIDARERDVSPAVGAATRHHHAA